MSDGTVAGGGPPTAGDARGGAPLVRPNRLGYVHVGAELERPRALGRDRRARRAVRDRVVAATAAIAALDGVRRVDVFDAVAVPPVAGAGRPGPRVAYDLVVLVECDDVAAARRIRDDAALEAVLALLAGAAGVHCAVLENARRIAEVDKDRGGVFLFNYFVGPAREDPAASAAEVIAVWERTAGWFTRHANLDNSVLLAPVDRGATALAVINHARWDSLLDLAPHLALRRSGRREVAGAFAASGVTAMPVLYRLAGTGGAAPPRPVAGWLIVALGVVHLAATAPAIVAAAPRVIERGVVGGIAREAPPPPEAAPALAALFAAVVGVLLLMSGGLLVRLQRARLRAPVWLGPALLATGLAGGVLLPASGFWLVALLGAWLVVRRP